MKDKTPYHIAQSAIADLKSSVYLILQNSQPEGLLNVEIGKSLGIYQGHMGHEGHIPRTLLAIMEQEGVVEQNTDTKRWKLK